MVQINIVSQGDLRCQATHAPSKTTLLTDAPVDNQGKGESFSPTDLIATALGTCMITTMDIVARRHAINLIGTTASVVKEMTAVPSRRVSKLTVQIHFPTNFSDEDRARLEHAANNCPVVKSLHPDVQIPVVFTYGSAKTTA